MEVIYSIVGVLIFILQFTAVTYIAFALLLALKYAILRNGWQDHWLAKLIFYPSGIWFLMRDVADNFVLSPVWLQLPNSHGEGWTVTSHIAFIKAWSELEIAKRAVSKDGIFLLTRVERWRYVVAMTLRDLLNRTEQKIGHKDHIK